MTAGYCNKCGGLLWGIPHTTDVRLCNCRDDIQTMQGWECPRCHKIHSPFVSTCDCLPAIYTFSTINEKTK